MFGIPGVQDFPINATKTNLIEGKLSNEGKILNIEHRFFSEKLQECSGKGAKKMGKKLTNVSLYHEMLVFLSIFPQQCPFFKFFNGRLGKKRKNVFTGYVCMSGKN